MADDPETAVVICYSEAIAEDDDFIRTLRKVSYKKPVVILKSGSSSAGAAAASSHTGALAGSDIAFDTAFEQAGIFRVTTMDEFCALDYHKKLTFCQPGIWIKIGIISPNFKMEFVGVGGGVLCHCSDGLLGRDFTTLFNIDGGKVLIYADIFAMSDDDDFGA